LDPTNQDQLILRKSSRITSTRPSSFQIAGHT